MSALLSRRSFLAGTGGLIAGAGRDAHAVSYRSVRIRCLARGDVFEGVYWTDGRYLPTALGLFATFARDQINGDAVVMDPVLLDIVWTLQLRYQQPEIDLLSGYRSPETNAVTEGAARNSQHLAGRALDLRFPGLDMRPAAEYLASVLWGGLGYYQRHNFVHVDRGPLRRWRG